MIGLTNLGLVKCFISLLLIVFVENDNQKKARTDENTGHKKKATHDEYVNLAENF
jgi:hypothetical protein